MAFVSTSSSLANRARASCSPRPRLAIGLHEAQHLCFHLRKLQTPPPRLAIELQMLALKSLQTGRDGDGDADGDGDGDGDDAGDADDDGDGDADCVARPQVAQQCVLPLNDEQ